MRQTRPLLAITLLSLVAATPGIAQGPPSTDVWLGRLELGSNPPGLGEPRNITARPGYDNQPAFEPEGRGLLYTSQRDGQTDIYRVDLETLVVSPITSTPESEYSPTITPGGLEVSVVRVEEDGAQRLWAFRRDGSSPRLILEDVAPVGYHAWRDPETLVLFVLGDPATLQLADLEAGTASELTGDIGRSLHAIPDSPDFSFTQRVGDGWMIRRLDPDDGTIGDLGAALAGSENQDMAWTPDGRILMAAGAQIFVRESDGEWSLMADLSDLGIETITRLAVSADGTRLAWVATGE